MKYICAIAFSLGVFGYGYLRGYCIGYDDAVESYTNLYNKIIKIQEETIEELKKGLIYEKERTF